MDGARYSEHFSKLFILLLLLRSFLSLSLLFLLLFYFQHICVLFVETISVFLFSARSCGAHDDISHFQVIQYIIVLFRMLRFQAFVGQHFVASVLQFILDFKNLIFHQVWHIIVRFEFFYYLVVKRFVHNGSLSSVDVAEIMILRRGVVTIVQKQFLCADPICSHRLKLSQEVRCTLAYFSKVFFGNFLTVPEDLERNNNMSSQLIVDHIVHFEDHHRANEATRSKMQCSFYTLDKHFIINL